MSSERSKSTKTVAAPCQVEGRLKVYVPSLRARCLPWERRCGSRDLKSHPELLDWASSLESPCRGLGISNLTTDTCIAPRGVGPPGPGLSHVKARILLPRWSHNLYLSQGSTELTPNPRPHQIILTSYIHSLVHLPLPEVTRNTSANVQTPQTGNKPKCHPRGG